jgi:hypothetical protein
VILGMLNQIFKQYQTILTSFLNTSSVHQKSNYHGFLDMLKLWRYQKSGFFSLATQSGYLDFAKIPTLIVNLSIYSSKSVLNIVTLLNEYLQSKFKLISWLETQILVDIPIWLIDQNYKMIKTELCTLLKKASIKAQLN